MVNLGRAFRVTDGVMAEILFIDDCKVSPAEVPVVETCLSIVWEYEMKGFRYRYFGIYMLKRLKPLICSLLVKDLDRLFCHAFDGFYSVYIFRHHNVVIFIQLS